MDGSLIPRPFSPTDAKRDRDEKARLAERGTGSLWKAGQRAAARAEYRNEELIAALEETKTTLQEADAQIAAAQVEADAARAELAEALAANDEAQAQLAADMTTLKDTTLPALDGDLAAARGRLDDAEADLESAFGQINTVDTRIATAKNAAIADAKAKADAAQAAAIAAAAADATAKKEAAEAVAAADAKAKADKALADAKIDAKTKADAAQAAAVAAAAADATAKAEQAEADAAATAAADAKAKADAAQAAALAAAKTYADTQASGASGAALDAAKADATAKADAAKAAAITAAALDATAKKEAAEAVAAADAKAKADKALADAKVDATSKANTAQSAAITAAAADATAKKEQAEANAAADASAKAEAARAAARAATAYSLNPSFDDWTGATPARFTVWTVGPTKETVIVKDGPFSVRFNCTDATTGRGLNFSGGALSAVPAPNLEYWTVELTFRLVSGTSLSGAGVRIDWSGMTNNQTTLALKDEIPTPDIGRWYTVTKTLRRPANATGTWTGMSGYLMGNFSSGAMGAMTPKDIVYDWLNIRPATAEEITSYGAPALIDAKTSEAQAAAIAAAAADATGKANAAQAAAISAAAITAQQKADAAAAEAKRQLDLVMASGANLVLNGGFESDDVWPLTSARIYDTAEKRSGARSLRLTPATANEWPVNVWVDSAEGRTYRLEYWIKKSGTDTLAGARANGFVAQTKTTAGGTGTFTVYGDIDIAAEIPTTGYVKVTADFSVTTANTVQVRFAPWVRQSANVYWVDDVAAYDITEAVQALAAANQAIADASAASGKAGGAQTTADAALNAATHTGKNLFSTNPPTGTAPYGTIWMQKGSGDVIIGQWQQTGGSAPNAITGLGGVDGSTWTKRDIDNQMIANLDVGKLTANTAVVNNAVAQKIAAATASFQQADVGNLTVTGTSKLADLVAQQIAADSGKFISLAVSQLTAGTASMGVGVIDKLYSEVVNSRKIIADQVVLGNGANSHPDPTFNDTGAWASNSWIVAGAGRNGGKGLVIPASATQRGSYYGSTDRTRHVPVTAGGAYRISAWVKAPSIIPAGAAAIYAKWSNPSLAVSGSFASPQNVSNAAPIPANTWFQVDGIVTVGDTAETMFTGLYKQSTANMDMTWSEPSIQPAVSPSLVATGAILAPHITASVEMSAKLASFLKVQAGMLEAKLVLASTIVAGDPAGTRAEMSPEGFRVYAARADGTSTEAVRLGVAASNDYFAVTRADGNLAATISEDGKISGAQFSADESLTYKGRELSTLLPGNTGQMVAAGSLVQTFSGVSSEFGLFDVSVPFEAGKSYRVAGTVAGFFGSAGPAEATMVLRYTTNGTTPSLSSPQLFLKTQAINPGRNGNMDFEVATFFPNATATGQIRVLLSILRPSGSAMDHISSDMWVYDTGQRPPFTRVINNGGGTVKAPVQNLELEAQGVTLQSYNGGGGSKYGLGAGKMYQGQQPAPGTGGNLLSVAMFNDLTSYLSGSTITGAQAYFYFEHWNNNSGGTASIGLHGVSGTMAPATFPTSTFAMSSPGWPKPGGRWVDIPPHLWDGFKSGAYRGLTLSAPGGDLTYYGIASAAKLFFKYNK